MQSNETVDGAVLVCEGVTKRFEGPGGGVLALDGVSLAVRRGEVVVVSGRTGAGKSTLLGILAGLERPSGGSVRLEGRRLEDLSGHDLARLRREKIGIVFQSFNLLASWTALENVEAAMLHAGLPRADRRRKAEALLAELGLGRRLDHLPSQLSVGQQQCVAVARALVNRPAVILADEPTGDVDDETARGILEHLVRPVGEYGAALVAATHGPFPLTMATRRLRLVNGRLET